MIDRQDLVTFEGPNVVVYRPSVEPSERRHEAILSRARRLQHATIASNLMEVVVTVGGGRACAHAAAKSAWCER
jgi:hypothetical protein